MRARVRATVMGALVGSVVLLAGGPAAAATPAAAAPAGPVVLLGTSGLRWDDIDDNPALSALLEDATGQLAVRSVRATTCPADGWLAISAGRRAADTGTEGSCRALSLPVPTAGGAATVPRWRDYVSAAAGESFQAEPGLLGETLAEADRTAVAVGPGAAIALARRDGTVAHAFAGQV